MKRPIFFILVFIVCLGVAQSRSFNICNAYEQKTVNILIDNQTSQSIEIKNKSKFSDKFSIEELTTKLVNMGLSGSQILTYIDSETLIKIEELIKTVEKQEQNSYVDVSDGYARVQKEQIGIMVEQGELIDEIISQLKSGEKGLVKISKKEIVPIYTEETTKELTNLKSKFTTYIYGLNQEGRIQNIKEASRRFNGKILMPGEKLSFNEIVGETSAENGYALAKVIINGKYEEDYGGGVCQVASTLYNSALLAGLNIERVAPHSLKVGYVAGSFDAMVSAGVSDLIISNPLDTPIYIHAYATDAECGFKIYGAKNDYDIVRRTEILEIDDEEAEKIAFKSEGYLDYYKDGELVESKRIRRDKYKKPI